MLKQNYILNMKVQVKNTSPFVIWKEKLAAGIISKVQYDELVFEYKRKLSIAAKRNNFGGVVYFKEHICEDCNNGYTANAWNSKYCKECKILVKKHGTIKKCSCNREGRFTGKYCKECVKNRTWNRKPQSEETKDKISKAKLNFYKTSEGNKVAKRIGKKNSIKMTEFYKTEKGQENLKQVALKNSITMKRKIANGEFFPPISNSWTHWTSIIYFDGNEFKFRSSWEACFWASNKHLLYEKLRIPYVDANGKSRTYIADFHDLEKNILFEIKPKSQWQKQKHKMQSVINYCKDNDIKFIWVNEYNILDYIDETDFKLEKNKIQLQKLYDGIGTNKNKKRKEIK